MMAVIEQRDGAVERYLRTASPAPCVPWLDASFAVLGLEVTGPVHPQSVGSLARLCSKNGDCNRRAYR
jgi:hypothetical protein